MAKQFDQIKDDHRAFIEEQMIFFVATAAPTGRVNVSPKGMDSLRVLGPNRIAWLNFTGSGNETAGHVRVQNRMTLMWCSFGKRPLILRAYGSARAIHPFDDAWTTALAPFGVQPGARQLFDLEVEMVQSSCGYAVPFMDNPREREVLKHWAADKGDDIPAYWRERNTDTIDGLPTGITGETP